MAHTLRLLCEKTLDLPLQRLRDDLGWLQLGGDSLSAMNFVDQARSHGLSVSVADVLGADSLAQLASKVKDKAVVPAVEHVEPFCLLRNQSVLVFHYALEQCQVPLSSLENLYPCTAHQLMSIPYMITGQCNLTLQLRYALPTDVNRARLIRAWAQVASSNALLRTRIIEAGEGSDYQAVIRDPVALDLETDPLKSIADPVADLFGFGLPLVRA